MKIANIARPLSAGALTFTAATAMTSVAAMALCGGAPTLVALSGLVGPPSISATESSTDQALELIRKRREEASGSCPSGFTRSGGNCVPIGAAVAAAPTPAPAQQAAAAAPPPAPPVAVTTTTTTGPAVAPQPKRPQVSRPASQQVAQAAPAPSSVPRAATVYGGQGSIKDGVYDVPMAGTVRAHGAWIEGYYDQERRGNLEPGRDTNTSRRVVSGGVLSGVDVSQYTTGGIVRGHQLGFFGGYNTSRAKFGDTTGLRVQDNNSLELTQRTNTRQEYDGAFAGIYGSMVNGAFSADAAFKVDFFDVNQSFTDTLVNCGNVINRNDSTTMTNYTVASNVNYRFNLGGTRFIEPTVGIRYTHIDYGSGAPRLGVADGDVFRVQGGLRLGMQNVTPDGWVWNTSLTGLLYSDVSVSGLIPANSGGGLLPNATLIDEGKLRVMGVLENRVSVGYGYTLYNDIEVRGGEDYFGFGTRAGIRYQW